MIRIKKEERKIQKKNKGMPNSKKLRNRKKKMKKREKNNGAVFHWLISNIVHIKIPLNLHNYDLKMGLNNKNL